VDCGAQRAPRTVAPRENNASLASWRAALGAAHLLYDLLPPAVTTDAGRMTIHLNYNAAQLPDDAAAEVAASLDALLHGAAIFL
jgi:hypothetical protein